MKFRYRMVDGDNETFSEWHDDDSALMAQINQPQNAAVVKGVKDMRQLYPNALIYTEYDGTLETPSPEKAAEITAKWMNKGDK